jgi:hypothetical protein
LDWMGVEPTTSADSVVKKLVQQLVNPLFR